MLHWVMCTSPSLQMLSAWGPGLRSDQQSSARGGTDTVFQNRCYQRFLSLGFLIWSVKGIRVCRRRGLTKVHPPPTPTHPFPPQLSAPFLEINPTPNPPKNHHRRTYRRQCTSVPNSFVYALSVKKCVHKPTKRQTLCNWPRIRPRGV